MASGKPLIAAFLIALTIILSSMTLNPEAHSLLRERTIEGQLTQTMDPRPNLYHQPISLMPIPDYTLSKFIPDYIGGPNKRTIEGPIETLDNPRPNQDDDYDYYDDYNSNNENGEYAIDPISDDSDEPIPIIISPPLIPDPDKIPPLKRRRKRKPSVTISIRPTTNLLTNAYSLIHLCQTHAHHAAQKLNVGEDRVV